MTTGSVLYDGVLVAGGRESVEPLRRNAPLNDTASRTMESSRSTASLRSRPRPRTSSTVRQHVRSRNRGRPALRPQPRTGAGLRCRGIRCQMSLRARFRSGSSGPPGPSSSAFFTRRAAVAGVVPCAQARSIHPQAATIRTTSTATKKSIGITSAGFPAQGAVKLLCSSETRMRCAPVPRVRNPGSGGHFGSSSGTRTSLGESRQRPLNRVAPGGTGWLTSGPAPLAHRLLGERVASSRAGRGRSGGGRQRFVGDSLTTGDSHGRCF